MKDTPFKEDMDMKMVEIKLRSTTAELEKLLARKERAEAKLTKTEEKCERLGCKWTVAEHGAWMDTVETANGWMTNKKEIELNSAWLDWFGAQRDVKDIAERIERLSTRFEKQYQEAEAYREEVRRIGDAKNREELQKVEFEQEQKEWAKDGINLEGRYYGTTPKGKRFVIDRNHGWTQRSLHCYTLYMDGQTWFTSGEFWRCYMEIKNH